MSAIYNWKTYYTLDEAKIISDRNIEKFADELIKKLNNYLIKSWKKETENISEKIDYFLYKYTILHRFSNTNFGVFLFF